MRKEKDKLLWVALACAVSIALFFGYYRLSNDFAHGREHAEAGFLLIGDESTPYSANFVRAIEALELQYGDRVGVNVRSNVAYEDAETVLRALCAQGCDIIFTNSYDYGETAKAIAAEYPDVEFCQATCENANEDPVLPNYHTFMGEIYQGRYIAGLVAGLKLQELVDAGDIGADEAWLGYVGAFTYAEVISGFTSFFLGVRHECPSATMEVTFTGSWYDETAEKEGANTLIKDGCVLISQHADSMGAPTACEAAGVPDVSYNGSTIDAAPNTYIISSKISSW